MNTITIRETELGIVEVITAGPQGPAGGGGIGGATAPITYDSQTQTVGITPATTSAAGSMSATDKTKLDGVAAGATANATDAQLRDRSTHTGTQAHTTIIGLGTAATTDASAYATAAQGTDSREWTADTITQVEAEAGTATTRRAFTAQRVFQAIAAWWAASAAKTKLDGIASGATANSSDATLLNRANHTGTQAAGTITGLASVATSGAYGDLSGRPTLGTAAPLDVAAAGDATSGQVVKGNDSRLSDARTPTAHNQAWSTITSTPTTRSGYGITDAAANGAVGSSGLTMATARLLGRTTASTGAVEEISVSGATLSGGTLTITSGTTNASDLSSGTLNDARLSAKVMAAVNVHLWSNFR
jgi:hypothetical protein